MPEIVYILTNESMPNYIKIGITADLERRMRELDNTSVPLPFECFYACTVKDMAFVEKQLHEAFADHRVRPTREFFELSPVRAASALKLVEIENVTPGVDIVESKEDQVALDKARDRRPNFNFRLLDIPPGSELTFIYDEKIKVTVIDERHIKLGEDITTVSKAAEKFMPEARAPLQGTIYWLFEGETINDRRTRLESDRMEST